jgi:hypothetical protein
MSASCQPAPAKLLPADPNNPVVRGVVTLAWATDAGVGVAYNDE